MANQNNRSNWILGFCKTNILENKQELIKQEFEYQLLRTLRIFKWNNLPDTIPIKDLELLLQLNGNATFTKVNDKYYVFRGGLGGVPNVYYLPTLSIVANPALEYNKSLEIDKDCVVILNDGLYRGLTQLFNKYASLLAECLISLRWAIINARVPYLIDADNDNTKKSAEEFLSKIIEGKDLSIIGHNTFFDGIKTYDYASKTTHIRDLLEAFQYIKASWFNDLGLQSNFNMKREALNSSETSLNEDILIPAIDEMLECRQIACEKINKMYGLNISVELSDVWKQLREDLKLDIENKQAEVNLKNTQSENIDNNDKEKENATEDKTQ
jgi:hypothetical protein